MESITNLIFTGINEFNDFYMFVVLCRLFVVLVALDVFAIICSQFAGIGK